MVCIGAVFGVYLFVAWIVAIWLMYFSIGQETTVLMTNKHLSENDTMRVSALANMWEEWPYNIYYNDPAAAQRGRELCVVHGIRLTSPEVLTTTSRELKAIVLFRTIDLARSGEVSLQEVQLFLARFGVVNPSAAAKALLQDKKRIGLPDFTQHFAVFYEYAFGSLVVIEDEHAHPSVRRKLLALAAHHENTQKLVEVPLHNLTSSHSSTLDDGELHDDFKASSIVDTVGISTPAHSPASFSVDSVSTSV